MTQTPDDGSESAVAVSLPSGRSPRSTGHSPRMHQRVLWGLRVTWASLPLVAGPTFAGALDDITNRVQNVASVGLWALWAIGLAGLMIPLPITLTAVRVLAPGALVCTVWATAVSTLDGWATAAMTVSVVATVVALSPAIGAVFSDGASYGDERRFLLRAPVALLAGPIPLAWLLTVAGIAIGPLLLGDRRWVAGTVVTALGYAVAGFAARALHALSRRWLIFVPGGVVVHDDSQLTDPVLFRRTDVNRMTVAYDDSTAHDLTADASGLVLEVTLRSTVQLPRRTGRRNTKATVVDVDAFLVTPTLPGAVLDVAAARRLPVN